MINQDAVSKRFLQLSDEDQIVYLTSKLTILEIEVQMLSKKVPQQESQQESREELLATLSETDRKLLELMQRGYRIAKIAERLGWSYSKTAYHRRRIKRYLQL